MVISRMTKVNDTPQGPALHSHPIPLENTRHYHALLFIICVSPRAHSTFTTIRVSRVLPTHEGFGSGGHAAWEGKEWRLPGGGGGHGEGVYDIFPEHLFF